MKLTPGPLAARTVLLHQPLARAVDLQPSCVDHDVNRPTRLGLRQRRSERQARAAPGKRGVVREPAALCCTDGRCGYTEPRRCRGHTMRTYSGRPSSSMRFSTSTAMDTSLAGLPPWRGGGRAERHAAARMVIPSMLARASAGVG